MCTCVCKYVQLKLSYMVRLMAYCNQINITVCKYIIYLYACTLYVCVCNVVYKRRKPYSFVLHCSAFLRVEFHSNGGIVLYWPTDIHFRVDNSNIIIITIIINGGGWFSRPSPQTHAHTPRLAGDNIRSLDL